MTLSIIETNVSESLSMVKTLVLPIITTIVFYSILLLIFIGGSRILDKNKKNSKFLKFFSYGLFFPLYFS